MATTNLTVPVPQELLAQARQYARQHDTTIARLITAFLAQLVADRDPLAATPIVSRLAGSWSAEVSADDYRRYLAEKNGCADSCARPG